MQFQYDTVIAALAALREQAELAAKTADAYALIGRMMAPPNDPALPADVRAALAATSAALVALGAAQRAVPLAIDNAIAAIKRTRESMAAAGMWSDAKEPPS